MKPQPTPDEALARLLEGNRRFGSNVRSIDSLTSYLRRGELVAGQRPFAVIIGCSDSRAPAEVLFDQGLGDLFVIRAAGPVISPSQIGSVEYAVEVLGTRLVLVLGHSHCGAITSTVEAIRTRNSPAMSNVLWIIDKIRPGLEDVVHSHPEHPQDELVELGVRANVRACVEALRHGSAHIEARIANGDIRIVGGEYHIETGLVELMEV